MNIILAILIILLTFWKGDWRNWEKYYPSMLYIALSTFVYEFISHEKFLLWELEKGMFLNRMNVHFVQNLIINPLVVLVYLSNYPNMGNKLRYNFQWVTMFWLIECIASYFDVITYHNGWNLGWSLLFIIIMFPMVRLHHVNKSLAVPLSIMFTVFLMVLFDYI